MSVKHLILIALGIGLLYAVFTVGAPFMLACVLALALEPLTKSWMRWFKWKRVPAAVLSCMLFTILLLSGVYYLILQIIKQMAELVKHLPSILTEVQQWVTKQLGNAEGVLSQQWEETIKQLLESASGQLQSIAGILPTKLMGIATASLNMFVFFIVFMVALFLISFSLDRIRPSLLTLFEEKSRDQVNGVITTLKESIFGFVRAQFILCGFTYVITLCGLLIIDTKYPLAIALIVMIVDLLPILGVGSALVPWAIFCLVTGDIFTGIGLIVLFIVITALRRIIEPKVLGDSVGIGALSALISLYIGFKLFGVIGFFIGPLAVIIYNAVRKAGLIEFKIKF